MILRNKFLLLILCILISSMAMTSLVKATPETLAIYPPSHTVEELGEQFQVNITIADVTDLWSYILDLSWNASILECIEVTEGPFMKNVAGTVFLSKAPEPGYIPEITCSFLSIVGASGNGVLATVTFNATGIGETDLHIGGPLAGEPDLIDNDEWPITVTVEDGSITVIPEFPTSIILPLFLILTAIIAIMVKIAWPRRRRGPINIP